MVIYNDMKHSSRNAERVHAHTHRHNTHGFQAHAMRQVIHEAARARSASQTETTTKKKLNQGVVDGRGGSHSHISWGAKAVGAARTAAKSAKMAFVENKPFKVGNTTGLQHTSEYAWFSKADCDTMVAQAVANQFQTAGPLGVKTQKTVLQELHGELQINNCTTGVQRVTLYDVYARRDAYQTSATNMTPNIAWGQGMADEITGGSITRNQVVGSTPFDSELFCKLYKVFKVTHIDLAPGQTHYHRISAKPNYVMDNELLQGTNIQSIKWLAHYTMLVSVGGLVVDTTGTLCTTGQIELLIVQKFDYRFTYVPDSITTLTVSNNLNTTPSAANNEINDITGTISTLAQV